MKTLEHQSNTIAAYRFINCLRDSGKTSGMIENVKNFIDETLLFKNDFEVMVIVPNVELKRLMPKLFTEQYCKYIEFKTMNDIMYRLSEFPIDTDNPYDIPRISQLQFWGDGKRYERFFVDPSCFETLCMQQLDKLNKIGELL